MLKVTRVEGTGTYRAYIGNGFIGSTVEASTPGAAIGALAKTTDAVYRPYVEHVIGELRAWRLSYADLAIGINTGTIVL